MARTGVATYETRAQIHENRTFLRGKLSGNRSSSQLTVTAFYSINNHTTLQISVIRIPLRYITLQFQL